MHFESLNDTFPNGDESNGRKKIPLTNPRFDSCPFHIWLIPIHPLNHYHQPQTKLAKPPPVDILVHWWRSPILPPWKFWNGGWWGFVGEVRLHTPLKENITNTNRWMFKPLRVMYSKATGQCWKLWDEGPQLIQCDDLLGSPPSHSGKGRFNLGIPNKKLIKILVVDIAHSFQWNEIHSTPTNQSTVPFVTPWRRIFILEKKACKSKKPKKFAC